MKKFMLYLLAITIWLLPAYLMAYVFEPKATGMAVLWILMLGPLAAGKTIEYFN